jgi:thiamine biosynthesis protein ThiI
MDKINVEVFILEAILVRYGEIGLKGDNRGFFESTLIKNIRRSLSGTGSEVIQSSGRIMIHTGDRDAVIERMQKVFGIVSLSPVRIVNPDLEEICRVSAETFSACSPQPLTFKVESRRSDKRFLLTSPEISKAVGAYILKANPGLKVDVHRPEATVNIEVREKQAYVFTEVYPGPGGLPVGVSGKGLLLLSGGIDSPVAGFLAMKRGIKLAAVHFHSFPYTSERSRLKVLDLAGVLSQYNQGMHIHIVNVAEIQETIKEKCPERFRVTLLRRMMLRIAEEIARRHNFQTLITGESVGQVASQTLESMSVIGEATRMLILKPLAGMDKIEICQRAEHMRTYHISIQPYDDCCSLFLPRHPATRPELAQVLAAEEGVDWETLKRRAMEDLEFIKIP